MWWSQQIPVKRGQLHSRSGVRSKGRAMAEPGPVIIDAIVDPLEPQLPAQLKPEQIEKFSQALQRGEANRKEIAANIEYLALVRQVI